MPTIVLTAGTSWTVPEDWNNSDNLIECIGAGGDGAGVSAGNAGGGGGGGGGYSSKSNVTLTPGANVSIQIGQPGSGSSAARTWFSGTGFLSALGGGDGNSNGAGGSGAAAGNGDVARTGGNGGDGGAGLSNAGGGGGGGGGAAGDVANGAAGTAGTAGTADGTTSNGGDGGSGGRGNPNSGGTGGAGGEGGSASSSGAVGGSDPDPGNDGTELGGGAGSGGGGGGGPGAAIFGGSQAGADSGAAAGQYGAGGGGGGGKGTAFSGTSGGAGAQGVIVIAYTEPPPSPGAETLVIVGGPPTAVVDRRVEVSTIAGQTLTLSGLAPVAHRSATLTPDAAVMEIAASTPAPIYISGEFVAPETGSLAVIGLVPTIAVTVAVTRTPEPCELTVSSAQVIALREGKRVEGAEPGGAVLALNGLSPTALIGLAQKPPAGVLLIGGQLARARSDVNRTATVPAGLLTLATATPTTVKPGWTELPDGSAAWTHLARAVKTCND